MLSFSLPSKLGADPANHPASIERTRHLRSMDYRIHRQYASHSTPYIQPYSVPHECNAFFDPHGTDMVNMVSYITMLYGCEPPHYLRKALVYPFTFFFSIILRLIKKSPSVNLYSRSVPTEHLRNACTLKASIQIVNQSPTVLRPCTPRR